MRPSKMKKISLVIAILLFSVNGYAKKFLPDDPLWQDPDCLPLTEPTEVEFSKTYNLLVNTFGDPGNEEPKPATNINTLGEVPNSSWFTNRIGNDEMTLEELAQGPNQGEGPDPTQNWTIISAKHEGITPGFVIEDNKGDRYFIKFDPKGHPQMSTSAEVVSTKFFYAFGYNVPENYLTYVDRSKLSISPDAVMIADKIRKRKMKQSDVDQIYKRIAWLPDGRVQAVASKVIPGDVIGTFLFNGTRTDDPNDIFLHEDRRELRGLRVFAAWLNHDEIQTFNTLDANVSQNGGSCIQHYLIDFNSTFGSANIKPNDKKSGNEFWFESDPVFKAAYSIGLWDRSWRYIDYPEYPSIGRFESNYFQPEKWKSVYPNTAFSKMQNDDAFWATKIVMKFTDDKIRALVKTGQYSEPEAEEYLIQTLLIRRDKIIRYYLDQLNPLDVFAIDNGQLTFKNLGIEAGLAPSAEYRYEWFRFDNNKITSESLGEPAVSGTPTFSIPADSSPFLLVRIQTSSEGHPNWEKSVYVYIRNDATKQVVGIERSN
jgi:hypothetical protein